MTIALVDTSVLCPLLRVPGKDSDHAPIWAEFRRLDNADAVLMLPLATILETGNHIAQARRFDSALRRNAAERFRTLVLSALGDHSPWSLATYWDEEQLKAWLQGFPDDAAQQMGLGDRTIAHEFERVCRDHTGHHVYVWSLDQHLRRFDRPAPSW